MKKIWTREKILWAFYEWKLEHGSFPHRNAWRKAGENHPSDKPVIQMFGTWEAVLRAAENFRSQRPHPDEEEIIALMKAWHAEHGIAPVAGDWDTDKTYPTPGWVRQHFGTWNAAIEAAGFYPRTRGITKKALARYTPLPRRRKEDHANQGSGAEASGDEGVA